MPRGRTARFRLYGDYPNLMAIPPEMRKRVMPRVVKELKIIAIEEAPKKRGLSSGKSIASRITAFTEKQETVGHVLSRAPHSHLLEFGVSGHSLAPGSGKRKWRKAKNPHKVMKVYGDPSIIRRGAWHGGSGANPFMERTEERGEGVVEGILVDEAVQAIEKCVVKGVEVFGGLA